MSSYKAKPTYLLVDVQNKLRQLGPKAFSSTSMTCARDELNMTVEEVISFILSRTDTTCYKTMPMNNFSSANIGMQDVYHWETPNGQLAYVKVSLHPGSKIVISFKEK